MITDITNLIVRYADTDQMKIVYYAEYLKYFEEGRSNLLKNLGFSYTTLESVYGIHLPVIEAHVKYLKSARFEDNLTIKTFINSLQKKIIRFDSEIYNNRILIVKGYCLHAFYNSISNKVVSAPIKLQNLFEKKFGKL